MRSTGGSISVWYSGWSSGGAAAGNPLCSSIQQQTSARRRGASCLIRLMMASNKAARLCHRSAPAALAVNSSLSRT